jgi:hypothetical protein
MIKFAKWKFPPTGAVKRAALVIAPAILDEAVIGLAQSRMRGIVRFFGLLVVSIGPPPFDLNYFLAKYPNSAELKHNRSRTFLSACGVGRWEARPMRFPAVPALAVMALTTTAHAQTALTVAG